MARLAKNGYSISTGGRQHMWLSTQIRFVVLLVAKIRMCIRYLRIYLDGFSGIVFSSYSYKNS